jgi:pilus assembly protein Flp/PilA
MLSLLMYLSMLHVPREKGQGLVEYALILVLVAIVVIAILLVLGPVVGNVFSNVTYFLSHGRAEGGGL